MPRLSISIFGLPHIECDGQPIAVDTRKAVALLVYLAVERHAHSRDTLATLLWSESDQTHARATLRRTLSTLNNALPAACLHISRESIELEGGVQIAFDMAEFRQHLRQCVEHRHAANEVCPACLDPLQRAVALYQADFLAGFSLRDSPPYEDWQLGQRDTLRRELAGALERLTRVLIARHAFAEAIPYARRWLDLDLLHEPAHRFLMRLYNWSGQHAAAIRQYRACVQVLDRELGVVPLEATTHLYEAIRDHRAPPPPARLSPVATSRASAMPPTSGETPESSGASALAASQQASASPPVAAPFVGREQEWAAALAAYRSAEASGHILAVEGEAGIGKTRLVEELAAYAREHGASVVAARCYEGEQMLAHGPIAAMLRSALTQEPACRRIEQVSDPWLSEAARLVPELSSIRAGLSTAPPLDGLGAQSRFFEGVRQVLLAATSAGHPPGLLFVDDLHWADAASVTLLAYLARRIAATPHCLVVTWRSNDVPSHHPLRQWLAEVQRGGHAAHITLERLPAPAILEWVAMALGPLPSLRIAHVATRVYEETEGLPFFVAEYVLALTSGVLAAQEQNWVVPGSVQDLLRSRLRALGEASRQVLTTAAVFGHTFDFAAIRDTSGRSDEETIAALEELIGHGLIAELDGTAHGEPRYDFTHQKLQALIYGETSLARRRLLHRRAAEALAALGRRLRPEALAAGQIAQHYLAAGDEAAAAGYFRLAGERARALYANEEALQHFQLALALGHADAASLHEAIGDLHVLLGHYAEALTSFESAAARAEEPALGRLEQKLSKVYARRGEWNAARSHLEAALALLGEAAGESVTRAHIFAEWSLIARRQGYEEEARAQAMRALALATFAGDTHALAEAHNILGVLASDRFEHATAIQHLEQSLTLAERVEVPIARAAALNNLALALGRSGDVPRALKLAEEALALCAAQGDRHHEAALHNTIADLQHAAGRGDDAIPHLKQAVAIFAEIGVEAGAVQPEIWKLAEW